MKRILLILFLISSLFAQAGNDRHGTYISTWYDALMMATDTTFNGIAGGQYMQDGRGNLSIFSVDGINNRVGFGMLSPQHPVDVVGVLRATSFLGDGSALTGIASGTGGVTNTGSTTIGADTNVDGSGVIDFQTRTVSRFTFDNAGGGTFPLDFNFTLTGGVNGVSFDGTTLSIDGANNRIGIGTATPAATLNILGTTEQFRVSYDATNYFKLDVLDDGHITFTTVDPDGAEADINFAPDGNVGIKTAAPDYDLDVAGNVGLDEYVYHNGDVDTYLRFLEDRFVLDVGGQNIIDYTEDATSTFAFDATGVADFSFGGTNVFIGGSEGSYDANVEIGTVAPSTSLQVEGGDGSTFISVSDTRSTAGDLAGIRFRTIGEGYKSFISHIETTTNGLGDLVFVVDHNFDNDDAVIGDEKMRLKKEGNLVVFGSVIANSNYVMEGYATGRNVFRSIVLQIQPGGTPNTDINVTDASDQIGLGWNYPSITDVTNLEASETDGQWTLSADGIDLTLNLTETVLGRISTAFESAHHINNSSDELYKPRVSVSSGNLLVRVYKHASDTGSSLLALMDAGDDVRLRIVFATST